METKIVNITLELPEAWVTSLEDYLRQNLKVINYKIIPDTKELYDSDKHFRKLVKDVKTVTKIKDEYINDHN